MLEELRRRNYAESTIQIYIHTVEHFSRHFHRSPDQLGPKLLDALRVYWRGLKRKPTDWLFPGNRWHTASRPVSTKVLWHACQQAAERAGLAHKTHPSPYSAPLLCHASARSWC